MQSQRNSLVILVAVVVAAIAGAWWWASSPRAPAIELPGLQVLDKPLRLPDFNLTDHNEAPFTAANLKGAWTLMFFGYGHCPDVCPATLSTVHQALQSLPEPKPRFVFVSVDPRRDTPATLKEHVTFVNPAFLGVTGPDDAQQALRDAVGVMVEYEDAQSGDPIRDLTQLTPEADYLVQHTASLFFIDPQGRLVAYLLPPQAPDAIRQTLQAFSK